MSADASDLEGRWQSWLLERNRRGTRTAIWLVIVLYPAFGLLDMLVAPPRALPALLSVRAFVTLLSFLLLPVVGSDAFAALVGWLAPAYVVLGALGISVMTASLGGLASPYYAGLTLYIVAIGLLFVWPARVVAATHGSIVGSFLLTNVLARAVGDRATAVSNLAFLASTALCSGVGQVLLFRTQREQHDQRVWLEQARAHLERAHQELQRLDQFKSRFFANLTHELRTPLAMVLAPLELMLQGEMGSFTEAHRSSFRTMFRSALKLLKLINDLLDLSRLEEARLELELQEHDLAQLLGTLTEQSQVLARRKEVTLTFRADAERLPLWCDPERLERVFVNLISNAVKFTRPGGHVDVVLTSEPGEVVVTVTDDGPGFPPEHASRIFERFYQVDMGGTRQHGGTGIGLALARELVLLHGGTIQASSDGVRGARFEVRLPRTRGATATEPAPGPPADEPAADFTVELAKRRDFRLLDLEEVVERRVVERDPDEESRPYSVVVVEDNPRIVQLVHMALRRSFKVLAAPDGTKGLEMVGRELPNLVVTDLMMPGLDGLELTQRLRADARTRHIPILMLTARGALDDRVKGLEGGANAYLTKPFSPRELVTTARQLVKAQEKTADLVLTQRMDSLETVAAGLAHEINNPLNYLVNALARAGLDAEQLTALARKATSAPLGDADRERLAAVSARMRDMLAVAGAGAKRIGGTVELMGRYARAGFRRELALHDAWDAVRAVVGIVLPATGRDVAVDVDLHGDGTLECVPDELNQVITNLVQNAIEAAPERAGRVTLRGSTIDGEVVLRVRDNGPGISPEAQARLFTPFFTTKGPGRGTGLGLTISRRVVQSLHGTLQVNSVPGEGAEFVLRLPARQPAAGAAP